MESWEEDLFGEVEDLFDNEGRGAEDDLFPDFNPPTKQKQKGKDKEKDNGKEASQGSPVEEG